MIRPKDAASLILHRPASHGRQGPIEVLMGRRPGKSSFMPDIYVFPGGAVDTADGRAKSATPLDPQIPANMAVSNNCARARSIALAAIRETFEETGLKIVLHGETGSIKHQSWEKLASQGVAADLAKLRYIGRATTPANRPIRFHARFFSCDTRLVAGFDDQLISGNGELLDLHWVSVDKIDQLPTRPVTTFMLEQMLILHEPSNMSRIGTATYTHRQGKLKISGQL